MLIWVRVENLESTYGEFRRNEDRLEAWVSTCGHVHLSPLASPDILELTFRGQLIQTLVNPIADVRSE